MELSIVVPCYNESKSVNEFYDSISSLLSLNKISYELIMVDDGSSDDTLERLKELNSKDKNVKVISFSRNFGKEAAMLAGLENSSGKYISIMDADMQHNPSTLIEMYKKLLDNKNYDVVCAYRENRKDEGTIKRTLTALFYKVINNVSEIKLLPGAGDFRVFKKCVRDAIVSMKEKTRFLKGMFSFVGFNTIYVPYIPEKRKYGTSKWSLIKLTKYSLDGIISFSTMPLTFIFIVGIIVFLIGLINFLLMGNLSFRTIILFVSFIMLSVGIIALYICKMYKNSLARPCYIIREKIGFSK